MENLKLSPGPQPELPPSASPTSEEKLATFRELFPNNLSTLQGSDGRGMDLRCYGALECANQLLDEMNEYAEELPEEFPRGPISYQDIFLPEVQQSKGKQDEQESKYNREVDSSELYGFDSIRTEENGAEIDTDELSKRISCLSPHRGTIVADVTILEAGGQTIRVVDLMEHMVSSVRRSSDSVDGRDEKKLKRGFYNELLFQLETGHKRQSVKGADGFFYVSAGKSKARRYATEVVDRRAEGVTTIAIIAQCGNSVSHEQDLYRRVFGCRLGK